MTTSRRARGEGSISHVEDRWVVRLWVGSRRLQRTVPTQREALQALADLRRRAGLGAVGRQTVNDILDDFISSGELRGWSPATFRSYGSAIDLHIRPALGRRPVADLTANDVERLLREMVQRGHSPRHVRHVRDVLRAALNRAKVVVNPAKQADVPRARPQEIQALDQDQLVRLFSALEGERLRAAIITMGVLGLRRGEAIALRWTDIDLDLRTMQIRRTGGRVGGQYIEGQPKSERSRRSISIPHSLVAELQRQRAVSDKEREALGPYWRDEDRVFPGLGGGPLGASTIRKALDGALERASLPHIKVHALRHSAASGLLQAGGSLRDAQELLGHSSYVLTANLYSHIADAQRRATAARQEAAYGAAILGQASVSTL